MTIVTGVAGSGKSTLINQVFTRYFPESIVIDQKGIQGSKRSNIATYSGILDFIRKLFVLVLIQKVPVQNVMAWAKYILIWLLWTQLQIHVKHAREIGLMKRLSSINTRIKILQKF
nr:hypothetical protein [Halocella sp. SP3-1]